MKTKKQSILGFTIVELIVVIVIIGVLASIIIVSYNGARDNAIATSLQSDLNNAADLLRVAQAQSSIGVFPATLAAADNGNGVPVTKGNVYQYTVNNVDLPRTFCLTATNGTKSYYINQEGKPSIGACPVLYLDAAVTTSYPGTGTTWYDLSGNGNDGTLIGSGITYASTNDGVLNFPGVATRVETVSQTYSNTMTWSAWIKCAQSMGSHNMFMGRYLPYFSYRSGNNIMFSNSISGTQRSITTASNLTLNTWYYTAFTTEYDGTNMTMKTYINGSLAANASYIGTQDASANKFTVGDGGNNATWYPFNGSISNVKVYNYTLSADEISKNFNAQRSRYGI